MGIPVSRRTELQDAIDSLMRSNRELERALNENEKLLKELKILNETLNKTI
jgi:chaperonin cofactor prefoldin